jgi:hypothetical protein
VQLALRPTRSIRELRAFRFWTEASCPDVSNWTDKDFFRQLLPRVAVADDATWYALIAASTLLEHPVNKRQKQKSFVEDDLDLGWHRQALEWYGCSLKAAKGLPTNSSTLVRTFLYGAVEMLQDRPDIGLALIHRSLILNEEAAAKDDADWEILNATLPMLTRALVPLGMFGLPVTETQRSRARRPNALKQSTTIQATLLDRMEELHNLIYDIQIFCNSPSPSPRPTQTDLAQQALLLSRIELFAPTLTSLTTILTPSSSEHRRFLAQLLVLHSTYHVKLATHFSPSLLAYDAYEPHFRTLLSEATRVLSVVELIGNLFAWEIATVPCLYYMAWACRRPSLRRAAIELLRTHGPRQENLWTAESALGRMERVVAWEEGKEEYVGRVTEEEDRMLPNEGRRVPMWVAGDPLGGIATNRVIGDFGKYAGVGGGLEANDRENQFWNVARLMTREEERVVPAGEEVSSVLHEKECDLVVRGRCECPVREFAVWDLVKPASA